MNINKIARLVSEDVNFRAGILIDKIISETRIEYDHSDVDASRGTIGNKIENASLYSFPNDDAIKRFLLKCIRDCFRLCSDEYQSNLRPYVDALVAYCRGGQLTQTQLTMMADQCFGLANGSYVSPHHIQGSNEYRQAYIMAAIYANVANTIAFALQIIEDLDYRRSEQQMHPIVTLINSLTYHTACAIANYDELEADEFDTDRMFSAVERIQRRYYNMIKSNATTRKSPHTSPIEPLYGFQHGDELSMKAAYDMLEEIGELTGNDFIYHDENSGEWVFNLGSGDVVHADNRDELAELIADDEYYSYRLQYIYNSLPNRQS